MTTEINPWEDPESPFYGVSPDWKPTVDNPLPRFRCTGTLPSGDRCSNKGISGDTPDKALCVSHGGKRPNNVYYREMTLAAARDQLLEFVPRALGKLNDVMGDEEAPVAVQLKAATEILDRAGIRGGVEIEHTVQEGEAPSTKVRDMLKSLRGDSDELEDMGETVDEEPEETR